MKPMLAKQADPAGLNFPVVAQLKLDGIRCVIVGGVAMSRKLKPIPNREIQYALGRDEFNGLDGELILGSPTAADCYRQTASYVMAEHKTGGAWTFHVFDKWDAAGGFWERFLEAESVVYRAASPSLKIELVENRTANSLTDLDYLESEALDAGHEGLIVRTLSDPYKFGRSGTKGPLLKVKRFVDFEAEVIGVYEEMHNGNEAKRDALGRTERSSAKAGKIGKGTLGGLILRGVNEPFTGVEFRCGSGFNAEDRATLWAESPHGRTAKIKAFPVGTKDKPRHPIFLGWRDTTID